ncbi:MAG: AAA family ATPase [Alphaproteobacteria bacterium]
MADIIEMPTREKDPPRGPVELIVTTIMREAAEVCQTHHLIGLVSAPAGVGKTTTWRMMAEADPAHVFMVTCDETMTTFSKTLARFQRALGRYPGAYESPSDRTDSILDWLRRKQPCEYDPKGVLIIVDEAQQLGVQSLNQLRHIWDCRLGKMENSCGLLLSGNPRFATNFNGKSAAAAFEHITSRIRIVREIPGPHPDDVLRLAAHLGVGDNAAQQFLCDVAAKPGALRNVTNLVKQARLRSEGARITAAQRRDAAGDIGL